VIYLRQFLRRGAEALRLRFPKRQSYDELARQRSPRYRKPIRFSAEGNSRVAAAIATARPTMVARIGYTELTCLQFFVRSRSGGRKPPYPPGVVTNMSTGPGFFPADPDSLDAFARLYLETVVDSDVLGVWFNDFEDEICNRYASGADLVELGCLEPFHYAEPWSEQLEGKRVLVIHPFAESIQRQYSDKRELLFANPKILPEFELKTLKAVQSIAGTYTEFVTWFDAYQSMCDAMQRVDFDIAIIGAGAYGLPLASFAKRLGRQAVHLGGVTQILFGIKGRRWETAYADTTAKMFNEHWVRPLPSETPQQYQSVEDGCYW